jgi:hypothetical protein
MHHFCGNLLPAAEGAQESQEVSEFTIGLQGSL